MAERKLAARDELPDRIAISLSGYPNAVPAGNFQVVYDGSAVNTTIGYNFANAQNDEFRWWIGTVKAGTWRLDGSGRRGPDRAIITWDMSFDDGSTWTSIGTTDGYNATMATFGFNITGITIPENRRVILRARALTRHASSTGWYMALSSINLTRTA